MSWQIDYNTFGSNGVANFDWDAIEIEQYEATPIFAQDNTTVETTEHTLSGRAIVSSTTPTAFVTSIANARKYLGQPGKKLVIKNGSDAFVELDPDAEPVTSGDRLASPRCEFKINEIYGGLTAIVAFKLVWHRLEDPLPGDNAVYHVLSHVWAQEFNRLEHGQWERTIRGAITVRADAPAAGDGVASNQGPTPDRYRGLIMPNLPSGYVYVEPMKFVADESATRLVYELVQRQVASNMPGRAVRGRARFKWARSLAQGGDALGRKIFHMELSGDNNVSKVDLLTEAVLASHTRIRWADTPQSVGDFIESLEIEEPDGINENSISMTVIAKALDRQNSNLADFTPLNPGVDLETLITSTTSPYQAPNPWGASLIHAVRRTLYVPSEVDGPTAATFPHATATPITNPVTQSVIAQGPVVAAASSAPTIPLAGVEQITREHEAAPYHHFKVRERIRHVTNTIAMPSMSLDAPDRLYQMTGPSVRLVTEIEIVRHGSSPPRVFLNQPQGSRLVDEDWNVSGGNVDTKGSRTFVAVYTRELEIIDIGQPGWDTVVINIPGVGGGGGATFTAWRPISNVIGFPFDPRFATAELASERTVLDPLLEHPEFNFPFTPEPLFTATA